MAAMRTRSTCPPEVVAGVHPGPAPDGAQPEGRPMATTEAGARRRSAAEGLAPGRGSPGLPADGRQHGEEGLLDHPGQAHHAPATTNSRARRVAFGAERAHTTSSTEALAGRRANSSKLAACPSAGRKATVPQHDERAGGEGGLAVAGEADDQHRQHHAGGGDGERGQEPQRAEVLAAGERLRERVQPRQHGRFAVHRVAVEITAAADRQAHGGQVRLVHVEHAGEHQSGEAGQEGQGGERDGERPAIATTSTIPPGRLS